jgi:hypothetical protein
MCTIIVLTVQCSDNFCDLVNFMIIFIVTYVSYELQMNTLSSICQQLKCASVETVPNFIPCVTFTGVLLM